MIFARVFLAGSEKEVVGVKHDTELEDEVDRAPGGGCEPAHEISPDPPGYLPELLEDHLPFRDEVAHQGEVPGPLAEPTLDSSRVVPLGLNPWSRRFAHVERFVGEHSHEEDCRADDQQEDRQYREDRGGHLSSPSFLHQPQVERVGHPGENGRHEDRDDEGLDDPVESHRDRQRQKEEKPPLELGGGSEIHGFF